MNLAFVLFYVNRIGFMIHEFMQKIYESIFEILKTEWNCFLHKQTRKIY